jgi:hypothetical protein
MDIERNIDVGTLVPVAAPMNMVDTARCAVVAGWVTEQLGALGAAQHHTRRRDMQGVVYDIDTGIWTDLLGPMRCTEWTVARRGFVTAPTEHDAFSVCLPDLHGALTEFFAEACARHPSCRVDAAATFRTCATYHLAAFVRIVINVVAPDGRRVDVLDWAAPGWRAW